jgi:hypothetical protein
MEEMFGTSNDLETIFNKCYLKLHKYIPISEEEYNKNNK